MARQLYSVPFQTVKGLTGTGTSVTVPAGHRYVIKQVTFYMNPTFGVSRAFLEDDVTGAALFSGGTTIGTPAWFGFYGAITFEQLTAFHFHVDVSPGDGVDCYVGGYDLTSP